MFREIDRFFENLTRDNWGLPWHIWLSSLAAGGLFMLIQQWTLNPMYSFVLSLIVVNLAGLGYEFIEYRRMGSDKTDMIQDMIGNNVGATGQLLIMIWIV